MLINKSKLVNNGFGRIFNFYEKEVEYEKVMIGRQGGLLIKSGVRAGQRLAVQCDDGVCYGDSGGDSGLEVWLLWKGPVMWREQ